MRKSLTAISLALGLLGAPAWAKPAIITVDVGTGIILSSNNIDIKQDPYLVGQLALIFIALNDVMTGDLNPEGKVLMPDGKSKDIAFLLRDASGTGPDSPAAMAILASQVAQSPNILNERMMALFRKVGMRATDIHTTRTSQGGPSWGGYTTNRDIARLMSALVLTHGKYATGILPAAEIHHGAIRPDTIWLYRDGMCVSLSRAEESKRTLVSVVQGASSEENCISASDVALRHNDKRIEGASRQASDRKG